VGSLISRVINRTAVQSASLINEQFGAMKMIRVAAMALKRIRIPCSFAGHVIMPPWSLLRRSGSSDLASLTLAEAVGAGSH